MVMKQFGGIRLPALVALFAAAVMLFCVFFPYAVATEKYAAALEEYADTIIDEDFHLTGKDATSFSMLRFILFEKDVNSANEDAILGWLYVVLLALAGLCILLCALFALMQKAIPTAVMALLSFGWVYLFSLDFTQRGLIDGLYYTWGIGYYLFHAAVAVAVGGSVWLFVEKHQQKRTAHHADLSAAAR